MKGIDIFCGSQAATAICISMEELASSSSSSSSSSISSSCPSSSTSTILVAGGGSSSPAIDRYNPIIRDSRRSTPKPLVPPSHPPLIRHTKNKSKKIPPKEENIDVDDHAQNKNDSSISPAFDARKTKSWSCTKPAGGGDFISPHGSTRYLLGEKVDLFNALSAPPPASDPLKLFPAETNSKMSNHVKNDEPCAAKPPSSSGGSPDQASFLDK